MNEYRLDGLTIKEHLLQLAEEGHRSFTTSLHPGVEHILGIRMPELRALAKRIAEDDWMRYLDTADTFYMEERMLLGLVLGYIRPDADIEAYLHRVTCFVWNINSWSVCDAFSFAGGKAFVGQHGARIWQYLREWMKAPNEYEARFGIVMAMRYFPDAGHLPELFEAFDELQTTGYYARMAVAWALCECFIRYPSLTEAYLKRSRLDSDTLRKALQKIAESHRITSDAKEAVRQLKN